MNPRESIQPISKVNLAVSNNTKKTEIGGLPIEWSIKKLKELLLIKGRIGWKGLKKSEFGNEGIIIVNGPEISEGQVEWDKCLRVPKWRYDESPDIALEENDILMTKDGTIGKIAFVDKLSEPATLASGIFLMRTLFPDQLDQRFLYQYLLSPVFKSLIENRIEGSVIPHLYQRDVEELLIPIPPINEQRKMSNVLFKLDSKIEFNKRNSKILESIAQNLFKHWFIDFEFPNNEGLPYRSSGGEIVDSEIGKMPKKWDTGKFIEEFNVVMGQSPPGSTYNSDGVGEIFFQGRTDFGFRFPLPRIYCTEPKKRAKRGDTLISVRAPVGDLNMSIEDCAIGRGLAAVRHITNSSTYTYYFMRFLKPSFAVFESKGTVFGAITKKDFDDMKIVKPDQKLILLFHETVNALDMKIEQNALQNDVLRNIKNLLLPKLMTGKIRVPLEDANVR